MSNESLKHFETLNKINVSEKIDKKGKFNYLSWSYAIEEMTKACPDWTYEIEHFNNLPYVYDEKTGYMIFTNITAFGIKKRMWLPVMDFQNKAKKNADMMDINKTIMRCLVKNIAMFGLGLYIFAGEDLPEDSEHDKEQRKPVNEPTIKINFEEYKQKLVADNMTLDTLRTSTQEYTANKNKFTEAEKTELENIIKVQFSEFKEQVIAEINSQNNQTELDNYARGLSIFQSLADGECWLEIRDSALSKRKTLETK